MLVNTYSHVETYAEFSEIALQQIAGKRDLIEVCGPISTSGKGSIEENLKEFEILIGILKGLAFQVFDQTPYEKDLHRIKDTRARMGLFEKYDYALLEEFYRPIMESGIITTLLFLPGYETSTGSKWEERCGLENNLKILYLDPEWQKLYQDSRILQACSQYCITEKLS